MEQKKLTKFVERSFNLGRPIQLTESNYDIPKNSLKESNNKINANDVINKLHITESKDKDIFKKILEKIADISTDERQVWKFPISRYDSTNANGRIYSKKLWQNVIDKQPDSYKGCVGLLDHPCEGDDAGSMKDAAIVWLDLMLDEDEKLVYGIGTFIGPYGRLADEIIKAGGKIGFSSSGFGELMTDGETVNPETYLLQRPADIVFDPSQGVFGSAECENASTVEEMKDKKEKVEESTKNVLKEQTIKEKLALKDEIIAILKEAIDTWTKKDAQIYSDALDEIENGIVKLDDDDIPSIVEGLNMSFEKTNDTWLSYVRGKDDGAFKLEIGRGDEYPKYFIRLTGIIEDNKVDNLSEDYYDWYPGDFGWVEPDEPFDESECAKENCNKEQVKENNVKEESKEIKSSIVKSFSENKKSKLSAIEKKIFMKNIDSILKEDCASDDPIEEIKDLDDMLSAVKDTGDMDLIEKVCSVLKARTSKLSTLIKDAAYLEKKNGNILNLEKKINALTEQNKLLMDQIEDYKIIDKNNDINESKVKVLANKKNLYINKLSSVIEKSNKKEKDLKIQLASTEHTYERKLNQVNNSWQNKLENVSNRFENKINSIIENSENTIRKNRDTIAQLKTVENKLAEKLDIAKNNNNKLVSKNHILEKENNDLSNKLDEVRNTSKKNSARINDLEEQLNTALRENKRLIHKLSDLSEENENTCNDLKDVVNRFSDYKKMHEETFKAPIKEQPTVDMRENHGKDVENYWNDLYNIYGESILPFEKEIRGAKTFNEAFNKFMKHMSEIDESGARAQAALVEDGAMTQEQRKQTLTEAGMIFDDTPKSIKEINEEALRDMRAYGFN